MSPLLANVALSMLDEHIAHAPGGPAATPYQRAKRRGDGLPNYRLVRYADDWVLPCRALGRTPKLCARRSQRCCPGWVCACRRTKH